MIPPEIINVLEQKLGNIRGCQPVGGGSINESFKLTAGSETFFCKLNSDTKFPQLFDTEKSGLDKLRSHGMRTPEVVLQFSEAGMQVLVMEWIEQGRITKQFWQKTGEMLASLHHHTTDLFGLDHDNYMGSVPQNNQLTVNWIDFFVNRRLVPVIRRCQSKELLDTRTVNDFEKLFQNLPGLFPVFRPSLLHGDLWNGNIICNVNSEPVFIDPAVYYGYPSIDMGMTMLFGGFDKPFYDSYFAHAKTDKNFREQCEASNLYPLLIHLYLFGSSYKPAIEKILRKYI